jgi:glycosyltransferase 2 family protein
VAGPLGVWARARRWWYLFPPGSDPPGLLPAMMIGYMANNVLPLRAGELVRVFVVARRWGHGFWTAVATSVVERILDGLVVVGVLCALLLLIPVPRPLVIGAITLLAGDVTIAAALAAAAAWPAGVRRVLTRLTRSWPGVQAWVVRILDTFVSGLDGIRTLRRLPAIVVWTVVVWILPAFVAWTSLRAANLDLPWVAGWTVLAFVGLSISIPSAPGYIGVFHFAAAKAVEVFGVTGAPALGFALVFHAAQFVPITVVGWFYLLRENLSLGEAARSQAHEAPPA